MSFDLDDAEPTHALSATAAFLDDLALFGARDDEAQRAPPEDLAMRNALAEVFDLLVATLASTALEPELEGLLWGVTNTFHRAGERLERRLDDNERAQREGQHQQDGSEVRSVELERLLDDGRALLERREALVLMRDHAAHLYGVHIGSAWRARSGSVVSSRLALTAAVIDSRDFLQARRRAERERLLPPGPRIAFAGGPQHHEVAPIWAALDRIHAKHADMVLLHGGAPAGAERIAACWADARRVAQVVFKPDWKRHRTAAPFRRNDQLLETLPIGVVVFAGNGISDNLADKAKAMGIPVMDLRRRPPG